MQRREETTLISPRVDFYCGQPKEGLQGDRLKRLVKSLPAEKTLHEHAPNSSFGP
jgi:hypothetical protein